MVWVWSGLCMLLAPAAPLLPGDLAGWFLTAAIGGTYLLVLLGPAIVLAPCWAEERARGTLESLALAPRPVADLWRMQIAARVRPWQKPAAVAVFALGVGILLLTRVDGELLLSLAAGLAWFVTAAMFGECWAAWVSTVYRGTVACVVVGILGALGVETVLFVCAAWAEIMLLFAPRTSPVLVFLAGFGAPMLIHVPLGIYYRRFAHTRLERMLGSLYP